MSRVGSMTSRTAFVLALAVALGGVPVRLSAQESQPHPLFELGLSGAFIGGAFDVSDIHQDVQTDTGGLSPSVGISLSERFSIEGAVVVDRVETEPVVTTRN